MYTNLFTFCERLKLKRPFALTLNDSTIKSHTTIYMYANQRVKFTLSSNVNDFFLYYIARYGDRSDDFFNFQTLRVLGFDSIFIIVHFVNLTKHLPLIYYIPNNIIIFICMYCRNISLLKTRLSRTSVHCGSNTSIRLTSSWRPQPLFLRKYYVFQFNQLIPYREMTIFNF